MLESYTDMCRADVGLAGQGTRMCRGSSKADRSVERRLQTKSECGPGVTWYSCTREYHNCRFWNHRFARCLSHLCLWLSK